MQVRDIGAYLRGNFGGAASATAAGAGDNTEVDGPWVDRRGYMSVKLCVGWTATLADTETFSLAYNLQDASDSSGTGAADYGTVVASTVQGTASGAETLTGVAALDIDLQTADRFIRAQHTPDLSAAGVDTSISCAILILGGADDSPAA